MCQTILMYYVAQDLTLRDFNQLQGDASSVIRNSVQVLEINSMFELFF